MDWPLGTTRNMEESFSPTMSSFLAEYEKEKRNKEAELISANAAITTLKRKLITQEQECKRIKLEGSGENEKLKDSLLKTTEKLNEMRKEKHKVLQELMSSNEAREACKEELKQLKASSQTKITSVERENQQLHAQLHEMTATYKAEITELKKDKMTLEGELSLLRTDCEAQARELAAATQKLESLGRNTKELELLKVQKLQVDEKVKELEQALAQVEEDATINRALKEKVMKLPEVEKENSKLKAENQHYRDNAKNVLILEEQVSALNKKLEKCQEQLNDLPLLQVRSQELHAKVAEWEKGFTSLGMKTVSPQAICKRISELQTSEALLLAKQGKLNTRCSVLEMTNQDLEAADKQLQQELQAEKEQTSKLTAALRRMDKKVKLLAKERDLYRDIKDSYESEVTLSMTAPQTSAKLSSAQELEAIRQSYQQQLTELESALEQAQGKLQEASKHNQQLEKEITGLQTQTKAPPPSPSGKEDQQIICTLRSTVAKLEKEVATLTSEKETLEDRIERRNLQGDYDPSRLKVLEFRMNPTALAQKKRAKELQQLKEENKQLQQKLAMVKECGEVVDDLTTRVQQQLEQPSTSKELEDLREQLKSAKLKNQRMLEAFKESSSLLRKGCYKLTGYRIDISSDRYKIMNMYAESGNDYLVFKIGSDGGLQLLETEYSHTVQDLIDTYLKQADSIPAFLSALTLELFKKQTILM